MTLHIDRVHTGDTVILVVATAAATSALGSQTIYKIGLANQRTTHLYHFKSRVEHLVDTLAADQTADIDQRTFQLLAELHRIFIEEGLLEGELLDHQRTEPTHKITQPQRHIVTHRVDRNQTAHYGHRSLAHKAARQHDAINAVALDYLCDLDRLWNLDTTLETILPVFAAASITSSIHIRIKRIRLSSEPPNSSRRWLVYGERNCEIR